MNEYYKNDNGVLYRGDTLEVLRNLPDECVDCIVTSPPYWGLRDYGIDGQIGLEPTLEEYLEKMLAVTAELKRVLKRTGVMFWNHGDSYASKGNSRFWEKDGIKNLHRPSTGRCRTNEIPAKCMVLQNYRLILRMVDEQGWILRNIIIWHKPNHMPSSVKDRFTNAYEPVFMLVKNRRYWFDLDAVRIPHRSYEQEMKRNILDNKGVNHLRKDLANRPQNAYYHPLGKNPSDLWTIPTQPFPEAHFAIFPERLVEPMIKAGCPQWICKKCGKARERIVKTIGKERVSWGVDRKARILGKPGKPAMRNINVTIGWTDCGCNAGWEPGIVLDPFMGSGTVAVVAERLGRRWIGIEINPEYCEMVKKRIMKERKNRKALIFSFLEEPNNIQ